MTQRRVRLISAIDTAGRPKLVAAFGATLTPLATLSANAVLTLHCPFDAPLTKHQRDAIRDARKIIKRRTAPHIDAASWPADVKVCYRNGGNAGPQNPYITPRRAQLRFAPGKGPDDTFLNVLST